MPDSQITHAELSVLKVKVAHLEKNVDRQDSGQTELRADVKELGRGQQELGHQVKELGMELKFDLETTKHQIEEKLSAKLEEMSTTHTAKLEEMSTTHSAKLEQIATTHSEKLVALATDVNGVQVDLKIFIGKIGAVVATGLLIVQYGPGIVPFI